MDLVEKLAGIMQQAAELECSLQRSLQVMVEHFELSSGWVWLLDAGHGEPYLAASYQLPEPLLEPMRMTGQPCRCLEGFRKGSPTPGTVERIACSRLRAFDAFPEEGKHTSFPLLCGEVRLGLLNLGWRPLNDQQMRQAEVACALLAVMVERVRLREENEIFVRQEERERLARDLHDTLAQSFTAIALQLEGAQMVAEQTEVAFARVDKALQISRQSLETTREVVWDLRGEAPLGVSLRRTARQFTSRTGIPVYLQLREPDLTPDEQVHLLRIVGEALSNVERHAQASEVGLELSGEAANFQLLLHDNGQGLSGPPGLGRRGMEERAGYLEARLVVESDQEGTRVRLWR